MIYTLAELKEKIAPIAKKYEIPAVWIFGSYARGEATDDSDVDVLFVSDGSKIRGFRWGALYEELRKSLKKGLDLVDEGALEQPQARLETPWFRDAVYRERIQVYGQPRYSAHSAYKAVL